MMSVCVFVVTLFLTCTDEIREYFQAEYGGVKDVIVKCDPNTKRSKCFGFIEFDNKEAMERVLRDKDDPGHTIGDRKVRVCLGLGLEHVEYLSTFVHDIHRLIQRKQYLLIHTRSIKQHLKEPKRYSLGVSRLICRKNLYVTTLCSLEK